METLSEAIDRLRAKGFEHDYSASMTGNLRCGACSTEIDPNLMKILEIVRFEGVSDPGDASILFALAGTCGHSGLYSAPYGGDATPEDAAVVSALHR